MLQLKSESIQNFDQKLFLDLNPILASGTGQLRLQMRPATRGLWQPLVHVLCRSFQQSGQMYLQRPTQQDFPHLLFITTLIINVWYVDAARVDIHIERPLIGMSPMLRLKSESVRNFAQKHFSNLNPILASGTG